MTRKIKLIDLLKSKKGNSSLVILCVTMFTIIFAALITDIGYASFEKFNLLDTARKTARTGAYMLITDEIDVENKMKEYALKMNEISNFEVGISQNKREITISISKSINYIFLKYVGFQERNISSTAIVKIGGVSGITGIRPFAIEKQNLKYNQEYFLTDSIVNDIRTIKYVPVKFGKDGYDVNILYGSRESMMTGSILYLLQKTERTGESLIKLIDKCQHQPKCTFEQYQPGCSKVILLPVVEKFDTTGKIPMTIKGFCAYFIQDVEMKGSSAIIKGKFIKKAVECKINDATEDFGIYGVELIQ